MEKYNGNFNFTDDDVNGNSPAFTPPDEPKKKPGKSKTGKTKKPGDKRGGKRPGSGCPALTGKGLIVQPGDISKGLSIGLAFMNMPKIDLMVPAQVKERIDLYFSMCVESDVKPGVAALSMALGLHRARVWEIVTGKYFNPKMNKYPKETKDYIKKAYAIMEYMWEYFMLNNKINPVSGIFPGKNHFGYQDRQEIVVAPSNPLGEEPDPEELARKYAADIIDDISTFDELPAPETDMED
jgi:hypothetical protein